MGALQLTNATIQKVSHLTLSSFSRTHRYALGGVHGPLPIGALLFMASAAHEVFKGVNLIDHVSLEEGYVFSGIGGFLWLGNTC